MDALPMRRNILLTLLLSLLVVLPAFFSISCNKEKPVLPDDEEPVVDSTMTTLKFRNAGPHEVENLQLLIYGSDGTRQLETLLRFDGLPDSVEVVTTEGEKLVAAVANSPKALSPVALGRYDSLKELGWDFNDEDPESPIMSGQCATLQNNGEIALEPLVCQVVIAAISNSMDDYELVESPRVRLVNLNGYAGVMQEDGFRPTETIDFGEWKDLPYDIGMFTQNPGTTLYCYPNETEQSSLGGVVTSLELECLILGEPCNFTVQLPPFGRGARLLVDITVGGPESCRFKIYEDKTPER